MSPRHASVLAAKVIGIASGLVVAAAVVAIAAGADRKPRPGDGGLAGSSAAAAPSRPPASQPSSSRGNNVPYAAGQLLVKFRPGVSPERRRAVRSVAGARSTRKLPVPGLELVELEGPVKAAEAAFEAHAEVAYAEPNFVYRTSASPNDPRFKYLWGLHNSGAVGTSDADVDAPQAWGQGTGSSSVTVAVVDTGVAYDHPDLASNIWMNPGESGSGKESNGIDDDANGFVDDSRGWDWVGDDAAPFDLNGHGSHVAGTIAAQGNNATGVAGVNWDAAIMPLRALGVSGSGYSSDIVQALAYAGAKGAHIVNGSFGGPYYSQAQADAITNAPGTLFVFAAGNQGTDNDASPTYPCSYEAENVVCVAASDAYDRLASFSNYGATSVDLAAPGASILSTFSPQRSVPFQEGFESDFASRWTTGGTNNSWGLLLQADGHHLSDSPLGDYLPATDSWAQIANPVDLTGRRHCQLDYWLDLESEPGDVLSLEGSTNGSSWTKLGEASGSTGGWLPVTEDVSAFDGEPQVYLRFRFSTDNSLALDGAHVDGVVLTCAAAAYSGTEYAYLSGTSMATPHVAGVAALLRAQAPETSISAIKFALLGGVNEKPSLAGKTVTGGRLNAYTSRYVLSAGAIDATAPTDVAVGGAALDRPFVTQKLFRVLLQATDAGSGVESFTVRERRAFADGGFGSYRYFKASGTGFDFTGSPGYTYCFSAAATDYAGNTSAYSPGRCTALPLRNTQLSHSGSWTKKTASGHYLNGYSISFKKGSELVRTGVQAKRLALVVTRCSGCGSVKVFFNGVLLKRVYLAASSTQKKKVVKVAGFGSVKKGTVRIRVASSGKPVKIEGLGAARA